LNLYELDIQDSLWSFMISLITNVDVIQVIFMPWQITYLARKHVTFEVLEPLYDSQNLANLQLVNTLTYCISLKVAPQ